jgi:sulfopyruvate decarboxylase TPP-binding subunit
MPNEPNSFNIPATRYIEALQRNGVDHFVTVPDWVQLALHLRVEAGIPGLRNVPCCNEEQALAVAAGLWMGGRKPIVVVQNQGMHACINALRTIGNDVGAPIVFLVGQFGREFANFGKDPSESRRSTVRYLEPVLQAMEVRSWRLERESDMPRFDEAFRYAWSEGRPAALLVGAPTGWM